MFPKKGLIAVAAREERIKLKAEFDAKTLLKDRLYVMRIWKKSIELDAIIDISNLPAKEVTQLVDSFEKVKNYCTSTKTIRKEALRKLSGLSDIELKTLIELLKK